MEFEVLTTKRSSIYVTAQDRKHRKSKTITVRGEAITPDQVIAIIRAAFARKQRKAG